MPYPKLMLGSQIIGMGLSSAGVMAYICHSETKFQNRYLYNFPGMEPNTYIRLAIEDRKLKLFRTATHKHENPGKYLFNTGYNKSTIQSYGINYIQIGETQYKFEQAMTTHELLNGNKYITLKNGNTFKNYWM